MGLTIAIWKWRPVWPFRFESRVMDGLAGDCAPFALTRFDAREVADEIRQRFGEGPDAPFIIEICDFTGHRANWIILSAGYSLTEQTMNELAELCDDRGLHIYSY